MFTQCSKAIYIVAAQGNHVFENIIYKPDATISSATGWGIQIDGGSYNVFTHNFACSTGDNNGTGDTVFPFIDPSAACGSMTNGWGMNYYGNEVDVPD